MIVKLGSQTGAGIAVAAVGVIAALVIGLSGPGCRKAQRSSGPREKITIAYSTASGAILVCIAFANGYFAEEGLEATPQPHAFGKRALNAVLEGKADLATVATTAVMFAVMDGKNIAMLAPIQTSNRNEAIVAQKDRGISKPADLRGKKIGVTRGTTADFFLDTFLLVKGIEKERVSLIDMRPDEMPDALGQGRVDAVSTFNPTLKQLENELGSKGAVFYGESFYTEIFCLAAERDNAKKQPEAIKKVMRALIKAEDFVRQHPGEARSLAAEFTKTDKAIVEDIWDIFTIRVSLGQPLLVDLEEQTRWAMKNKLTSGTNMPDYLEHIYADGLYAVKPEAVRYVR